jgi:hypothetical protein
MGTPISQDIIEAGILAPEEIRSYDHTRPSIHTKTLSTKELLEVVDFLRHDFREFKRSRVREIRRRQELSAQRFERKHISDRLEEERRESQYLIPEGVPPILLFQREDPRIKDLGDELHCFTSDIRMAANEWHDCEQGVFRWSRPTFECPFFLKDGKDFLEIFWATMRDEPVEMQLSINQSPLIRVNLPGPEWRTDQIPLSREIRGTIWLKVEVSKPFHPQGDSRELGVAVQRIRFLKSGGNTS